MRSAMEGGMIRRRLHEQFICSYLEFLFLTNLLNQALLVEVNLQKTVFEKPPTKRTKFFFRT